jgi:2-polyprenyl-3-methyl-5-hydroxy-6-metoxy-1,4-benzoquinol methylase
VSKETYAESFGLQWNRFANTQIDSKVGTNRSEIRFREETLWDERDLNGKLVLDAGCGSGRFSEIALKLGASLIAVDYSSAVEASKHNLSAPNKLIVQGDLAALPILDRTFDFI